jgi:hypothetical protein
LKFSGGTALPSSRRRFIHGASVLAAALFGPRAVAQTSSSAPSPGVAMINEMTFEDVRKLLDLTPNATCGYVRVTFIRSIASRRAAWRRRSPFADGRAAGSALYFMMTPEEPVKLHRIRNDQLYHYYLGDPIEVLTMARRNFTSSARTSAGATKFSSSFRAAGSTPRGSSATSAGFSAPRPNGRVSSPPMSNSAMPTRRLRNIRRSPPRLGRSPLPAK